jgi:AraC family transcriptional regulator
MNTQAAAPFDSAVPEDLPGQSPVHSVRVHRGLAPHRLHRIAAFIEANFQQTISVPQLASEIHMSPFHFARMFKLSTALSPHAYIVQRRMELGKTLLATTALPLGEVAIRVGYRTQPHFTSVFRRHVGTTPHAYRLRHQAQT